MGGALVFLIGVAGVVYGAIENAYWLTQMAALTMILGAAYFVGLPT